MHNEFTAFPRGVEGRGASRKELAQVIEPIRGRANDHNRDFASRKVLLVAEVCVQGNQHIKSIVRETQKVTVLLSRPPCFLNRATLMTLF